MEINTTSLLEVRNLTVSFDEFIAVDDMSFSINAGETLAVVGESGSGKSVSALSVMRLVDLGTRAKITSGEILFRQADGAVIDLLKTSDTEIRKIRGNHISMVFQEPLTSLNPVYTAGEQVAEVVRLHQGMNRVDATNHALRMFEKVRIPRAKKILTAYPHELSGGMRQRVMIAMALACNPKILIADEPTTALDVTIQAQILNLVKELQEEMDTAVMLITHDMGVVAEVADHVIVMRNSKLIETGSVYDVFESPKEPYTQALLSSIPRLGSMVGEQYPRPFDLINSSEVI